MDRIKKNFGFGCMRLPMIGEEVDIEQTKQMVDAFLDAGFNYFDTAHGYIQGKSEKALKTCLTSRYPREKYILTDKLTANYFKTEADIRPFFESQLEICGVEYFDFYLMHAQGLVNYDHFKECRAYETAFELKKEGKIRHVGISFHDRAEVLERILTEYPEIEVVQIQFNYVDYDDPAVQSRKCYEVCRKFNKPVIVMEPVKGGSLVNLPEDAQKVKDIEKITNHDVKAVEYFIKEKCKALGISRWQEFVHFGLTSQDINNTSQPLMLKEALENEYIPALKEVISILSADVEAWKDVPMLARTHGQPATPTRLGKEFQVFVSRLEEQLRQFGQLTWPAKFGGATGNMNAHKVAFPDIDWPAFADRFVASLGLKRSFPTTQIDHYDNLAAIFDCLRRINTILIDLCRDIWTYISMEYFHQQVAKNEVGSSAMPHKVNPIDFENAEGNLGMANAVLTFLSMKLPISRLQRDLTDSTVQRNIGVPVAHGMIALASLKKGLGKLILNRPAIDAELHHNWAVVAEAIQTILRRENYPNPYETLKNLTRTGAAIDEKTIEDFISTLDVADSVKEELRAITPWNYTGF